MIPEDPALAAQSKKPQIFGIYVAVNKKFPYLYKGSKKSAVKKHMKKRKSRAAQIAYIYGSYLQYPIRVNFFKSIMPNKMPNKIQKSINTLLWLTVPVDVDKNTTRQK